VSRNENAVDWDDFTRFKKSDVANDDVLYSEKNTIKITVSINGTWKANLDVNDLLKAIPKNLDATSLLSLVQSLELAFFLPVIYNL